jgi:2-methylaconitate cis-trans-isomerase PrpF
MAQKSIKAAFMRGGTSKAVVFRRSDLPADPATWDDIFLSVMGSPDPNGRQLDGMGGGISSLSKICIVGPPSRVDADIDFTFAQISVKDASVDYSANCGNMCSAVGPFAAENGLCTVPRNGIAVVRIHNTNTNKVITSRFTMTNGEVETDGDLAIDGVAGTGASVRLEFNDPGGAKTGHLMPTGRARDRLDVPGFGSVVATMVDAANPCVFIDAAALGKTGTELPEALEADDACLRALEAIRQSASVAMGIAPDLATAARIPSVPKVAMVAAPKACGTLSGRLLAADEMSILVRMISIGQPHRAVPITGATCLAIAIRIEGSVPSSLVAGRDGPIVIAHPSGVLIVDARVDQAGDAGKPYAVFGAVYRTTRKLFEGHVYYRQGGQRHNEGTTQVENK